jgi:hypothetical protein
LALAPWLKYLPKAVLYGVFLFMGVSSLNGNELFERLALWAIWDTSRYPQYPYLRKVSVKGVHIFTAVQALGLAVLYALKSIKQVAVVFPFFIAFLAIIRPYFGKFFTQEELDALDGDEDEEETCDAKHSNVNIITGTSGQCIGHDGRSLIFQNSTVVEAKQIGPKINEDKNIVDI